MRTFCVCIAALALFGSAVAAEKTLQMKDLPPAVQKGVQDEAKGAEIKNIGKEIEKGKTTYEVETMLGARHRDFVVDAKGSLLEVEDETTLDAIPAAAKAAIEKKVGTGKLTRVEKMTRGRETFYEASYTAKSGRKMEALFKPDGTATKD